MLIWVKGPLINIHYYEFFDGECIELYLIARLMGFRDFCTTAIYVDMHTYHQSYALNTISGRELNKQQLIKFI